MKNILAAIFAIFAMFMSSVAFAQVTPEEQEWIQALSPILAEARQANIKAAIVIKSDGQPGDSPAALAYRPATKQCVFILAVRGNPLSATVQNYLPGTHGNQVSMLAIAAHEYAHCLQFATKLNLVADTSGVNGTATLESTSTAEDEGFADVYALAWFAQNRPEDFELAYRFFKTLRAEGKSSGNDRYNVKRFLVKTKDFPEIMRTTKASPVEFANNVVYGTPLQSSVVALNSN